MGRLFRFTFLAELFSAFSSPAFLRRHHFKAWKNIFGKQCHHFILKKVTQVYIVKFQEFMTTCEKPSHEPSGSKPASGSRFFLAKISSMDSIAAGAGMAALGFSSCSLQEECWKQKIKNQSNSNVSHKLHQMGLHSCLLSCCLFLPFETPLTWP